MFNDRLQSKISFNETFSADATRALARADGEMFITGVDVFNASSVATHATDYITFKIINLGSAGSGTTVIAAASTSQTGGSAMTSQKAFPLTITAANATVADGSALGFIYDESTTDFANSTVINVVVRYVQTGPPS